MKYSNQLSLFPSGIIAKLEMPLNIAQHNKDLTEKNLQNSTTESPPYLEVTATEASAKTYEDNLLAEKYVVDRHGFIMVGKVGMFVDENHGKPLWS